MTGLRLTIVGCSGSFPGPSSPASSYLLTASDGRRDWQLLLDLGNGALGALQRHIDPFSLDAVAITHLHPDHCLDLCGLFVMHKYRPGGRSGPTLPVYGPAGLAQRLEAAYGSDPGVSMAGIFDFQTVTDRATFMVGPFTVQPFRVNHPVEAYGYRVSAGGRILAFTGDTDTCDALGPLMTGADLALTDAAFLDGRDEVPDIHLSGSRAAAAALAAGGVRRLMLTHIPAWNDPQDCRAQAATIWPGEVEIAQPDASYEL